MHDEGESIGTISAAWRQCYAKAEVDDDRFGGRYWEEGGRCLRWGRAGEDEGRGSRGGGAVEVRRDGW